MFAPLDPAHRRLAHGLVDSVSTALEAPVELTDARLRPLARSEFSPIGVDGAAETFRPRDAARLRLEADRRDPVHVPAVDEVGLSGFWMVPLYGVTRLRALLWVLDGTVRRDSIAYATEVAATTIVALDRVGAFDLAPPTSVADLPGMFATSSTDAEDALEAHVRGTRITFGGGAVALAVAVDPPSTHYTTTDAIALTLRRALARAGAHVPANQRMTAQSGTEAVLVLAHAAEPAPKLDRLAAVVQDYLFRHRDDVPSGLWTIGTSNVIRRPERPGRAAWQAVQAARLGLHLGRTGRSVEWSSTRGYHGVYAIPQVVLDDHFLTPERREFFDDPRCQDLVATLESYLEHAGNVQAVAAARYVHRTNVYHRIRRAEAELGVSLSDGHDRLELHIALMAWRLSRPRPSTTAAGAVPISTKGSHR